MPELLFLIIVSRFKMHSSVVAYGRKSPNMDLGPEVGSSARLEYHALAGMLVDSCPAHLSAHTQHFNMQVDGDASLYLANLVHEIKTFDRVVLRCLQPPVAAEQLTQRALLAADNLKFARFPHVLG